MFVQKVFVLVPAFLTFGAVEIQAASAPLPKLIEAAPNDAGISIRVPTGGCTAKSDFEVTSHPVKDAAEITFTRLKQDFCKGNFPNGVSFQFSWSDMHLTGVTKLIVKNPIEVHAISSSIGVAAVKKKRPAVKRCSSRKRLHGHCKRHRHRHLMHAKRKTIRKYHRPSCF